MLLLNLIYSKNIIHSYKFYFCLIIIWSLFIFLKFSWNKTQPRRINWCVSHRSIWFL